MFNYKHYIPILKWKAGEYRGVTALEDDVKKAFTPLIELQCERASTSGRRNRRSVGKDLRFVLEEIAEAGIIERPFFISCTDIIGADYWRRRVHPLVTLCEMASEEGILAVPVLNLDYALEQQGILPRLLSDDDITGIGIRLDQSILGDTSLHDRISEFLDITRVELRNIDLFFDLGAIPTTPEGVLTVGLRSIINDFPRLNEWRTFTLVGTAFPQTVASVQRGSGTTRVPRTEWLTWLGLINSGGPGSLKRLPTYGDYGIQHPTMVEFDPIRMTVSANIRYTSDEDWLIFKGKSTKKEGLAQFHSLARSLTRHPDYRGREFSWGDNYVYECANRREGPGNPTTWRSVGTNHHLTLVVDQIANLPSLLSSQ